MARLLDTSVLVRLANSRDDAYAVAMQAVIELHRRGEVLHITAQNLIEFWNVATRPAALNGLQLSVADVEAKSKLFEAVFPVVPETPEIFPAWKALVQELGVIGKQVHDARLVAVCQVNSLSSIVTFNFKHFVRFAAQKPYVVAIDPASIC